MPFRCWPGNALSHPIALLEYTPRMGLKATTVRMSEDLWQLLEEEAARQGVSAAHVMRDSVLLRLGHLSAARGDHDAQMTIEELARRSLQERRRFEGEAHTKSLHEPRRLAALQT